uniref:RNase H type-1 domain-containing protein n=1 Tax=Clastoptera arizonana TaxID=38151 RepID=A0A1B6DRT5_9HEMI
MKIIYVILCLFSLSHSNYITNTEKYRLIDVASQNKFDVRTDLLKKGCKRESAVDKMRTNAMETIHTRYPKNLWLHVYSDGSIRNSEAGLGGIGGAGVYSEHFTYYKIVGFYKASWESEIAGLKLALKELINLEHNIMNNIVIFIDSKPALRLFAEDKNIRCKEVISCMEMIRYLKSKNKNIVLQWIPSHCHIPGNAFAHKLARLATNQLLTNLYKTDMHFKVNRTALGTSVSTRANITVVNLPTRYKHLLMNVNNKYVTINTKWILLFIPIFWRNLSATFQVNTKGLTNIFTFTKKIDNSKRPFYRIHISRSVSSYHVKDN